MAFTGLDTVWDMADSIITHQTTLISLIILVVILVVAKKFGKGIGGIFEGIAHSIGKV